MTEDIGKLEKIRERDNGDGTFTEFYGRWTPEEFKAYEEEERRIWEGESMNAKLEDLFPWLKTPPIVD